LKFLEGGGGLSVLPLLLLLFSLGAWLISCVVELGMKKKKILFLFSILSHQGNPGFSL